MQSFSSDGIEIAYLDEGAGAPVLLIHGFSSNAQVNWLHTGWIAALVESGRRVVALDNRGHGASQKIHDPAAYAAGIMAGDSARLLGHLGLRAVDVIGYSMGARITAFLTLDHQDLVRRAVFGGLGINMVRGTGDPQVVIDALEAPGLGAVADPRGRMFRKFADSIGADLPSLAACMKGPRPPITPERLSTIGRPVLVAAGTDDEVAGSPAELAALIPGARVLPIEGRDHMKAVGDKSFIAGTIEFLNAAP